MSVSADMAMCSDPRMGIQRVVRTWLTGWLDLIHYRSIPGYATFGWFERKRTDLAALCFLFRLTRFRCAALLLLAVQLIALSLTWHWDLDGWSRDLLRVMPVLMVIPWFASARRFAVVSLLRDSDR